MKTTQPYDCSDLQILREAIEHNVYADGSALDRHAADARWLATLDARDDLLLEAATHLRYACEPEGEDCTVAKKIAAVLTVKP